MFSNSRLRHFLFLFAIYFSINICISVDVTVSTYNLWNVMFNWPVRKLRIAQLIKQSNADIIAFQEVRMDFLEDHSQISELKKLLPEYKWAAWRSANSANTPGNYIDKGWLKEGIGVLSRLPILNSKVQHLPYKNGPDTNRRLALHAEIRVDSVTIVNIIAVHFSYHRQQQCHNSAAVLKYVQAKQLKNVIVLGDFNTYVDFDDPVRVFTDRVARDRSPSAPCFGEMDGHSNTGSIMMIDTWLTLGNGHGFTFSNMPTPGYESRPDRILASKSSFQVTHTSLSGNGTFYKKIYRAAIRLRRIRTLLATAFHSFVGYAGYPCAHDCGPRGSCRCGVCIKGGNSRQCNIPDCDECNAKFVLVFTLYAFCLTFLSVFFLYALLKVLLVSAKLSPDTVCTILGCTCCLMNPQLYSFQRLSSRHRFLRVCAPIVRLPPALLLICSLTMLMFLVMIGDSLFTRALETTGLTMDEEFYPSDHLMYTVKLSTVPS